MAARDTVSFAMPGRVGKPSLPREEAERVRDGVDYLLRTKYSGNKSELGRDIGCSQSAVTQWMTRTNRASLQTSTAIARLLGMPEPALREHGLPPEKKAALDASRRESPSPYTIKEPAPDSVLAETVGPISRAVELAIIQLREALKQQMHEEGLSLERRQEIVDDVVRERDAELRIAKKIAEESIAEEKKLHRKRKRA